MSIYLSRVGQVFGPFEKEQIEIWKKSGEILHYVWIFDERHGRWESIHSVPQAMPAAPEAAKAAQPVAPAAPDAASPGMPSPEMPSNPTPAPAVTSAPRAAPPAAAAHAPVTAPSRQKQAPAAGEPVRILCHDYRSFISGEVLEEKGDQFDLWIHSQVGDSFPFRQGQRVLAQILHPTDHRVETRSVLIKQIQHHLGAFRVEISA